MHSIPLELRKCALLNVTPLYFRECSILITNMLFLRKPDDSVRNLTTQTQYYHRNVIMKKT